MIQKSLECYLPYFPIVNTKFTITFLLNSRNSRNTHLLQSKPKSKRLIPSSMRYLNSRSIELSFLTTKALRNSWRIQLYISVRQSPIIQDKLIIYYIHKQFVTRTSELNELNIYNWQNYLHVLWLRKYCCHELLVDWNNNK